MAVFFMYDIVFASFSKTVLWSDLFLGLINDTERIGTLVSILRVPRDSILHV